MKNFSFGRKELGKPTPAVIAWRLKLWVIAAGATGAFIQAASWIPALPKEIIGGLLGLSCTIGHLIEPMFGVDIPNIVPKDEVTAIETDTENK